MPSSDLCWAVLCSPHDASGPWVARGLRARGLDVRVVTTEELVFSTALTHRVDADAVSTSVRLPDGAVFGPGLRGTLNRVTHLPSEHLARASPQDREYAVQELHALLTSVLHGLPGVVANRPDARGLAGPWLRPAEWMVEAARAGLTVLGYRSTGGDDLPPDVACRALVVGESVVVGEIVTDDSVFGATGVGSGRGPGPWRDQRSNLLPADVERGCLLLARQQGVLVLGVDLAVLDGRWVFCGATPTPDLFAGGEPLLDALHEMLT